MRICSSDAIDSSRSLFPAGDMHPIPSIVPWIQWLHSARIEVRMATDPSPSSRSVRELFCHILGMCLHRFSPYQLFEFKFFLKTVIMYTPVPCDKYNTCDSFTVYLGKQPQVDVNTHSAHNLEVG
jgi:hypothetical protein